MTFMVDSPYLYFDGISRESAFRLIPLKHFIGEFRAELRRVEKGMDDGDNRQMPTQAPARGGLQLQHLT